MLWIVLSWVVEDREPWDVGEQLGVEKESQYLEVAGEDMRKGQHRAADRLERRWRDWTRQQTLASCYITGLFNSVRAKDKGIWRWGTCTCIMII